jgi:hypothetical protein
METLKNEIYGAGVVETTHQAYELAKRDYLQAVKSRMEDGMKYYGKQMNILHKAWIALDEISMGDI